MPRSHKTLPRLFVEAPLAAGNRLELGREQTNYLLTVLRMKAGEALILFNGSDGAWMAKIADDHRKGATLEVVVQTQHQTPTSDLWFGFAPLKTGLSAALFGPGTDKPLRASSSKSFHALSPWICAKIAMNSAALPESVGSGMVKASFQNGVARSNQDCGC